MAPLDGRPYEEEGLVDVVLHVEIDLPGWAGSEVVWPKGKPARKRMSRLEVEELWPFFEKEVFSEYCQQQD